MDFDPIKELQAAPAAPNRGKSVLVSYHCACGVMVERSYAVEGGQTFERHCEQDVERLRGTPIDTD